jgi:hypothetical protein
VENTNGFSSVAPRNQRTYEASSIRCVLVYLTNASMAGYSFSARYFFTRNVSPVSALGFFAAAGSSGRRWWELPPPPSES